MRFHLIVRFALSFGLLFAAVGEAAPLNVTGRAGTSEFYVRYTLGNFEKLIDQCLNSIGCSETIARRLLELSSSGLSKRTKFDFVTSRELGVHLYRLDHDDLVTVNKDMLFIARNGSLDAYVFSDAVDFLARVFGERRGWPETEARLVAYRLSDMASRYADRVNMPETDLSKFAFTLLKTPVSALVIEDTANTDMATTLEVPFDTQLSCGTTTGVQGHLRALRISTASWAKATRAAGRAQLSVYGTLAYKCLDTTGREAAFTSKYIVQIDAEARPGYWYLNVNSLRIRQNGIHAASLPE